MDSIWNDMYNAAKLHRIEIMMVYGADRVVTLGELTPDWWIK